VYWCTNNVLSLIQTGVLKKESIRVALDIPKPPAAEDNPAMKLQNPFKIAQEVSYGVRVCMCE
jgi:membrane protein insertase Oxa1/YidC/SpoIIIJ